MIKGDIVRVKAVVRTAYGREGVRDWEMIYREGDWPRHKNLFRVAADLRGLVLGTTYLATGKQVGYEDCYLEVSKRHKVWKVARLEGLRYLKPVCCLEEDLEVIVWASPWRYRDDT